MKADPGAVSLGRQFGLVSDAFMAAGLLSCVVNILMLTGPLFMLQVYDRVLTSQSVPTLVGLLGLAVGLYVMMGMFDFLRARVLSRVSHRLDERISSGAYRSWLTGSLGHQPAGYRPLHDLATIRGFLSSPTAFALFDLPWFPFYLLIVFALHVQLGMLATAGAVVVLVVAFANERLSGKPHAMSTNAEMAESHFLDQVYRNADSVMAMGMMANTMDRWRKLRDRTLFHVQSGTERSEHFTAFSKAFRLLLQSCILALGGYLVIQQEISAGMIVAASIISGRALAPIDQTIGGWRSIKRTASSYKRLSAYLKRSSNKVSPSVELPAPAGQLTIDNVFKFAPGTSTSGERRAILNGVRFSLEPGDGLGVIGPSASGKSTLAKLLVGLWMPDRGAVRIDGATFDQWDPDRIGRHVGYLPQQYELIAGTIAQNIARFEPDCDDDEIIAAAKMAGVHEMILGFPDGYETDAVASTSPLTGGQKQRIALARAVYRSPKLVVLDEPNSNLDTDGDIALANAIAALRSKGSVVVVMAHRPSAIAAVDKLLMLKNGSVAEFGAKSDVLKKVSRAA